MNAATGADERLVVMLEARVSEFEKRMQKAERTGTDSYRRMRTGSRAATQQMEQDMVRATNRINQAMATTATRIGSLSRAFVGGLAGGIAAAAFGQFSSNVRGVIADLSNVAKAADRVGLSTDALQGLQHGLGLAGVSASDTASAMEHFVDRLGDARLGTGELSKEIERSGISLTDNAGKMRPVIDLLKEYSDVVKSAPDAAARMQLVTAAFGRQGRAMAQAFAEGGDGLEKMIDEARKGGHVLEEDVLRRAEQLDDKFEILSSRLGNVFKRGVIEAATFFGFVEQERAKLTYDPDDAKRLLGVDFAEMLAQQGEVGQEAIAIIEGLQIEYNDLADAARDLVPALSDASNMMRGLGNDAAADSLTDLATRIGDAAREFETGTISGETYAAKLREVAGEASATMAAMNELDQITLSGVIGQVSSLLSWIEALPGAAAAARAEIGALEGMTYGSPLTSSGNGFDLLPPSGLAPTASPRPGRRGVNSFPEAKRSGGGGGKGGGGSSRLDSLIAELLKEEEILTEWYAKSIELLNSASEAQLLAVGGKHEALERLEQEHADRLAAIDQLKNSQRLGEMGDFFGAMASLTAAGGDKLVKVTRVFGALEAFANTKRAQAQVLADPKLGFFGKMAAYATIGAAGLGVVAALKGGSSGGGGGGSASSAVTPSPEPAAAQPTRLTIDLVGEGQISRKQLGEILSFIQQESKNGVVIDSSAKRAWG